MPIGIEIKPYTIGICVIPKQFRRFRTFLMSAFLLTPLSSKILVFFVCTMQEFNFSVWNYLIWSKSTLIDQNSVMCCRFDNFIILLYLSSTSITTWLFCKGFQQLRLQMPRLSACVVMWTESQKSCKVWALINQSLPRYFRSCGLWLTSQIIKSIDISQSIDFKQSIWINQFYPIKAMNFIR